MTIQPQPSQGPPLPPAGSLRCPRCSATVGPDQDWCLDCGAPARTRLAQTPNWQLPTVAIGAIVLLAGAMLAFAFVKLTDDDDLPASTTPTAAATAPPVAPPAGTAPVPGTTTPIPGATTPVQGTTTPGTPVPVPGSTATVPATTPAPTATTPAPTATTPAPPIPTTPKRTATGPAPPPPPPAKSGEP